MKNTYLTTNPESTVLLANQIETVVGEKPADWGLTSAQMSLLQSTSTALGSGNQNVVATRQAARAATQNRMGQDTACKSAIADIARSIYANKSLTPGKIASLGLVPRKTTRTKVVPVTPTSVVASVQSNGGVLVTFNRAGNAPGVIFRVEAQTSIGGDWAFAAESTATRLILKGYPAGGYAAFRIVASKGSVDALPSDVAVIYPASVATPVSDAADVDPRFLKKAA